MARIRTIKPEFPQSESMGNVSRDARLLFILMWTIADDEGRLRGNSRMLASLLFPYDSDAGNLIDGWLDELVKEACITVYQHESATYIQIAKWLNHQKIDKPSKSKIPTFDESPRILDESSRSVVVGSKDQGSKDLRIKEETPLPPSQGELPATNPTKPNRERKGTCTLSTWLHTLKATGEKAVSDYKPLLEYAEAAKLPEEFLQLAWDEFKRCFGDGGTHASRRQADWRRHFRNYVEKNYYALWFVNEQGQYALSSKGRQAKLVFDNMGRAA